MAISLACKCGKRLRANDRLCGRRVKCPACGSVFRVPQQTPEPKTEQSRRTSSTAAGSRKPTAKPPALPERARVRIRCRGGLYWGLKAEVLLDGKRIGRGSCRKGFDLQTTTTVGTHTLEATSGGLHESFAINFPESGSYEVGLRLKGWTSGFPNGYSQHVDVDRIPDIRLPTGFSNQNASEAIDLREHARPRSHGPAAKNHTVGASSRTVARLPRQQPEKAFFNARVPAGGAQNSGESMMYLAFGALGGAVMLATQTPAFRDAKVELRSTTLRVLCKDAFKSFSEVHRLALDRMRSVRASHCTREQQTRAEMVRSLVVGLGAGLLFALILVVQIGASEVFDSIGSLAFVIGFSAIGGQVLSFLFLMLPALLRPKRDLKRLEFQAKDGSGFAVFVDNGQFNVAADLLQRYGLKIESTSCEPAPKR